MQPTKQSNEPPKKRRLLMDKVSERMRTICEDFYLVIRDLRELCILDDTRASEQHEIDSRRKTLIERLGKVESNIQDLATLAGWYKFMAEADGVDMDSKEK
jgi:hypothetical protein